MAYFLKKPFKMSPNSRVNLVHFHLEEVRVLLPDHPFNRASPNGGFRPPRLYSAAVDVTGSTILCPEKVFVTRIPLLTGPTPEDAAAAVSQFRLNLALNSSSSHHKFCSIRNRPAADDGGQNYADPAPNRGSNYIPDLNVSPPNETAPTTDFVGEIKSQNISRFTDHVVCCLGWSDEEVAEYKKILSSKTEAEIGNLDSIRIWNILTLRAEILKALVAKGLVDVPFDSESDDVQFPPPQQLLPIPQQGWTAAHNHAHIGCHVTAAAAYGAGANYNGNNGTSSDGRNYAVGYEKQSNMAKRKAVAFGGVDEDDPCPYVLPMKKPSEGVGGVLCMDEDKTVARDKAPIDEAEEEEDISSDSDSSY